MLQIPLLQRHPPFHLCKEVNIVNKDQVKGRVEQVKGKLNEVTGAVIDNDKLEAKGKAEQVEGKIKANFGDAKEAVKDKAKDIINKL